MVGCVDPERRNVRGKVGRWRHLREQRSTCPKCPAPRLQTIGAELSRTCRRLVG
jgi:hypothetical protein